MIGDCGSLRSWGGFFLVGHFERCWRVCGFGWRVEAMLDGLTGLLEAFGGLLEAFRVWL